MEDQNPIIQGLNQLMTANGYNLYKDTNRARADDLLVRQKVSGLLGDTANRLAAMASDYRRTCMPPSTREHPFPSDEAMAPMRQMESLKGKLSTLSSTVRGLPVPTADRTWAKFRSEKDLLNQLLMCDYELIRTIQSVSDTVDGHSAPTWTLGDGHQVETLLGQFEQQLRHRQMLLQSS
jgi:hypothetical protein